MARACGRQHRSFTKRCSLRVGPPSRANPSRDGDAKPGIFLGKTARLPVAIVRDAQPIRGGVVKANLARFTVALSLLATMALTLAAGLKWH